jgi:hypothetical protein
LPTAAITKQSAAATRSNERIDGTAAITES